MCERECFRLDFKHGNRVRLGDGSQVLNFMTKIFNVLGIYLAVRYLMGDNLKLVWTKFSTKFDRCCMLRS